MVYKYRATITLPIERQPEYSYRIYFLTFQKTLKLVGNSGGDKPNSVPFVVIYLKAEMEFDMFR